MCVTACIRTRCLILNGSDDAQDADPSGIAVNAEAVGTIQPRQRLRLRVTGITSLSCVIYYMVLFRRVRRVGDSSFLIENTNLLHAGFGRNRLNRAVQALPIIP